MITSRSSLQAGLAHFGAVHLYRVTAVNRTSTYNGHRDSPRNLRFARTEGADPRSAAGRGLAAGGSRAKCQVQGRDGPGPGRNPAGTGRPGARAAGGRQHGVGRLCQVTGGTRLAQWAAGERTAWLEEEQGEQEPLAIGWVRRRLASTLAAFPDMAETCARQYCSGSPHWGAYGRR